VAPKVLISDFDGTITQTDFFSVVLDHYVPADAPDYLAQWRSGEITHFEAMQRYLAYTPTGERELSGILAKLQPEPELHRLIERLTAGGWDLIVVSAGCSWYIERVLNGAPATIHASPGRLVPGSGLVMKPPSDSPFFCPAVGVSKEAAVSDALERYEQVAYAGDSRLDVAPSLLVPAEWRFARGFLAEELTRRGEGFRAFERWRDVVLGITC
jgi:2,3-diketo-5-methylthio-1-phosphopentane phosphatase